MNAQPLFGRDRTVLDTTYPGDIIGLVNANALGVGDTIDLDEPVAFPPIATFAPEHFAAVSALDSGRTSSSAAASSSWTARVS